VTWADHFRLILLSSKTNWNSWLCILWLPFWRHFQVDGTVTKIWIHFSVISLWYRHWSLCNSRV